MTHSTWMWLNAVSETEGSQITLRNQSKFQSATFAGLVRIAQKRLYTLGHCVNENMSACLVGSSVWVCHSGWGQACSQSERRMTSSPDRQYLFSSSDWGSVLSSYLIRANNYIQSWTPGHGGQKDHITIGIMLFILFVALNLRMKKPLIFKKAADESFASLVSYFILALIWGPVKYLHFLWLSKSINA